MKYKLTAKALAVTEDLQRIIKKSADKLERMLPHIEEDLDRLEINIRANKARGFYEGIIILHLPKRNLTAKVEGDSLKTSLKLGFEKIFKELKKYKGLHFTENSEYPDRDSIRKVI